MSDELTAAEIGDRLRVARESAKVTQAAAAEALQVARTTVVAIEQGQRKPEIHDRVPIEYDPGVRRVG